VLDERVADLRTRQQRLAQEGRMSARA
jgi:hypothetical protein